MSRGVKAMSKMVFAYFFTRTMRLGSPELDIAKIKWGWDWDVNGIYLPPPLQDLKYSPSDLKKKMLLHKHYDTLKNFHFH